MTDRIEISISGDLPAERKYAILADAEAEVASFISKFMAKYPEVRLTASVRAVRPGKKGAIVQANTLAPEPLVVAKAAE